MPRSKNLPTAQLEYTVEDFATTRKNRKGKKISVNSFHREVKHLYGPSETEEIPAISESIDSSSEEWTESDLINKPISRKPGPKAMRKRKCSSSTSRGGCDYPLDLWFLLSDYLRPEDVETFAKLCRSADYVVSTARFWIKLYRRYYRKDMPLPGPLQPDAMTKTFGIRAAVIRSLYIMYEPFRLRLTHQSNSRDLLTSLKGAKCLYTWTLPDKTKQFRFKFKFRRPALAGGAANVRAPPQHHYHHHDVFYNPDQDCCLATLSGPAYSQFPAVMGMELAGVWVSLSRDMRSHAVKLAFQASTGRYKKCTTANCVFVILDPITTIQVLDWYHPSYLTEVNS